MQWIKNQQIVLKSITVLRKSELKNFGARLIVGIVFLMSLTPFNIFSANPNRPVKPVRRISTVATNDTLSSLMPDTIALSKPVDMPAEVVTDEFMVDGLADSVIFAPVDSAMVVESAEMRALFSNGTMTDSVPSTAKRVFVPDPIRAVWMSALFPGLGQIYNRRFWKLPIVIGGFMGLGYGASWNNSMLTDYTKAYYDLMDNDPNTKSYMDFFPPTTSEESLDRTWLERVLKNRKDYFRRNRDLCVIGMIGVYLLAVVDAYVDASLTNFDISPDLTMQIQPTMLPDPLGRYPALGLQCAFNF